MVVSCSYKYIKLTMQKSLGSIAGNIAMIAG